MAELFENMEELDIQAERRNTEEQRQRAEAAEQRANEAEQKARNESQRAEAAEQKAQDESQRADAATLFLIKSYLNAGVSDDAILQILTNELGMNKREAASKIEQCRPPLRQ